VSAFDCFVTSNTVFPGAGGGLYAFSSRIRMEDTNFRGNNANTDGGGVSATQSSLIFESSTFSQNGHGVDANGGAVHLVSSVARLNGTMFRLNADGIHTILSLNGSGIHVPDSGAIWAQKSFIYIVESAFQKNRAKKGGALNLLSSVAIVEGTRFAENEAVTGGALAVDAESRVAFEGDTNSFESNTAVKEGGAIFLASYCGRGSRLRSPPSPNGQTAKSSIDALMADATSWATRDTAANASVILAALRFLNSGSLTTTLQFVGKVTFTGNSANSGGAVFLADRFMPCSAFCQRCVYDENVADYGTNMATKAAGAQVYGLPGKMAPVPWSAPLSPLSFPANIRMSLVIEIVDAFGNRVESNDELITASVTIVSETGIFINKGPSSTYSKAVTNGVSRFDEFRIVGPIGRPTEVVFTTSPSLNDSKLTVSINTLPCPPEYANEQSLDADLGEGRSRRLLIHGGDPFEHPGLAGGDSDLSIFFARFGRICECRESEFEVENDGVYTCVSPSSSGGLTKEEAAILGLILVSLVIVTGFIVMFIQLRAKARLAKAKMREADLRAAQEARFVAFVFHELRNPLNGTVNYAKFAEEALQDIIDELVINNSGGTGNNSITCRGSSCSGIISDDIRAQLSSVLADLSLSNKCTEHAVSVLNNVLDLSKLAEGKLTVSQERVNIAVLLREVLVLAGSSNSDVRMFATLDGLQLSQTWTAAQLQREDSPWLLVDARKLKQVLINLLSNAIKFTEKGTIEVRVNVIMADKMAPTPCNGELNVMSRSTTMLYNNRDLEEGSEKNNVDGGFAPVAASASVVSSIANSSTTSNNSKRSMESISTTMTSSVSRRQLQSTNKRASLTSYKSASTFESSALLHQVSTTSYTREGNSQVDEAALVLDAGVPCELRVEVRDSGSGIPPSVQKRLFFAYEQASSLVAGTGLGLMVSQEFINVMGGKIEIESPLNFDGTEIETPLANDARAFDFNLPAPSPKGSEKKGTGTSFYFTIPTYHLPSQNGHPSSLRADSDMVSQLPEPAPKVVAYPKVPTPTQQMSPMLYAHRLHSLDAETGDIAPESISAEGSRASSRRGSFSDRRNSLDVLPEQFGESMLSLGLMRSSPRPSPATTPRGTPRSLSLRLHPAGGSSSGHTRHGSFLRVPSANNIGDAVTTSEVQLTVDEDAEEDVPLLLSPSSDAPAAAAAAAAAATALTDTFRATAAQASAAAASATSPPPLHFMHGWRILIVDDVLMNRRVLTRKFMGKPFKALKLIITEAKTGEEAIERCKTNRYDLITLDQHMEQAGGVLTGSQTCEQLRAMFAAAADAPGGSENDSLLSSNKTNARAPSKGVTIISCTGNVSAGDVAELARVGVDHVWAKPLGIGTEMEKDIVLVMKNREQR
jgi:signal transduction histidine kinase/CheY-like chemotaxis protein